MSEHLKGLFYAVVGVLVLSPDTLLIRLAEVDHWALLAYRGVLMSIGMIILLKVFDKAPIKQQFFTIGKQGVITSLFFTISTLAFVNATIYTTIAHTLVLVATSPLFASLFGWMLLGERPKSSTFIAIAFVLSGMILVVGQSGGESYWLGNICALISAISIAMTFVLTRQNKQINMVPAIALSGLMTTLVALPFALWTSFGLGTFSVIILMGLVIAIAFALITLAARHIPAAEVSLILPLETVGGVALAWWLLNEVPTNQTILGATIILLTLTIYGIGVLRQSK